MTTSFIGSNSTIANQPPLTTQRKLVVANVVRSVKGDEMNESFEKDKEENNGRRNIMFAAAAVVVCFVGRMVLGSLIELNSERKLFVPDFFID